MDKVQNINLNELSNMGIKGLILDIDNTLVPSFIKEANSHALDWIGKVKSKGFKLCLVSNATKRRVDKFNEKLRLEAIYRASKPISLSFRKALKVLDLRACEAATVGDQIFTDIYGGNKIGMYTILVKPINKRESLFIRLKRLPERYILKRYYEAMEQS